MTAPKTATKNRKIAAGAQPEPQTEPPALLAPAEVRALRESLGVSRSALSELTGLSGSRVWAAEQPNKEVTDAHRMAIVAALRDVEANGLPAHLRKPEKKPATQAKKPAVTRAVLAERLAQVTALLDHALQVKTLKEIRALVEQAQAAAVATPEPSQDTETTAVDQTNGESLGETSEATRDQAPTDETVNA